MDSCNVQLSRAHGCWHRGHERDPGRSRDVQLFAMLRHCSRQSPGWEATDREKAWL